MAAAQDGTFARPCRTWIRLRLYCATAATAVTSPRLDCPKLEVSSFRRAAGGRVLTGPAQSSAVRAVWSSGTRCDRSLPAHIYSFQTLAPQRAAAGTAARVFLPGDRKSVV